MKWGKIKQILSFFTALMLVFGTLTGCKNEEGTRDSSELNAHKEAEAGGKPSTWIADRTITVQAYVDDIGNTLPKNFNNTPTMKKITELTGIKLDVRYTPGDSDEKVMASQLASGTIPDVIISYLDNSTRPEFPLLLKAAREGMFADVSEYMKNSQVYSKYYEEGYLPRDTYDNIVFRKDQDGVYFWQMNVDSIDKSLMYIPEEEYKGGMYIQKSIADALEVDPVTIHTKDQFYDLLRQIKAGGFKDDNGNDVWPLGPKYWGGSADSIKTICPGLKWGVSGDYNIDKDGNVRHEVEMDSIYDEINYIRKLLNEGLMNPEFFTMDFTRAQEVSKNNNSAIIADVHNYEDIIYAADNWMPLGPLNDMEGDNREVVHGKTGRGCMAISSEAKYPEEIFQFFDWLSTVEGQLVAQYGAEGVTFQLEDGKPVLKEEVLVKLNEGDVDYLINEVGSALGGSGNYFFEFVITDKNNSVNFGETRPGSGSGKTFERSVLIAKKYPREKKLIPGLNATSYLSVPELAPIKTQMDLLNWNEVLIQTFYAKDDAEVKRIVDSFRSQLKAAGVEQFEEYVKRIYEEDKEAVNFYGYE